MLTLECTIEESEENYNEIVFEEAKERIYIE